MQLYVRVFVVRYVHFKMISRFPILSCLCSWVLQYLPQFLSSRLQVLTALSYHWW